MAVAVGLVTLYLNGGTPAFILRADGLVSRDHVTVAPPFEGRVASVLVHPGDHLVVGIDQDHGRLLQIGLDGGVPEG